MQPDFSQKVALDYSALKNAKTPNRHPVLFRLTLIIMFIAMAYGAVTAMFAISILGIGLGIVIIIGLFLAENRENSKRRMDSLQLFAEQNGFSYSPSSTDVSSEPGSIFKHGDTKIKKHILSGYLSSLPFSMYTYVYTWGSGRMQNTYEIAIFELTLPHKLPHMVFDSLTEPGIYSSSTLPIIFDRAQRIDLEGDFSRYFALYAPDKYGVSALTVLAPDAMQAIVRHATQCDIEIVNNKLYFYWPGMEYSEQAIEEKLQTVQGVLSEIGKKLVSGNLFAHDSHKQLHTVAAQPLELQKWRITDFAQIMLLSAALLALLHMRYPQQTVYLTVPVFFIAATIIASFRELRISRLKKSHSRAYSQKT